MPQPPHILCINPWVHDFAAHDFWANPLGLLYIAAILRSHGLLVSYIDCLDRFHPKRSHPAHPGYSADGRGAYRKTPIPKPLSLADVPATFSRYGIAHGWFEADLRAAGRPDLVLITAHMTYWYTGVAETIAMVKTVFPKTPVVLGGIYASLMPAHARAHTGADEVVPGAGEDAVFRLLEKYTGLSLQPAFDTRDMNAFPYPALDLQREIPCAPVLTARGCPNRCAYCASYFLQPRRMVRRPEHTAAEIVYWHEHFGVRNIAFYDDALLADAENNAIPLFERLAAMKKDLAFHAPNAIHVRAVTREIATLMYKAGFENIRLGLETADDKGRDMDDKVCGEEFVRAARFLLEAGFDAGQVGANLLVGLPGQDLRAVEASIDFVVKAGLRPLLTYYAPIPHTRMWEAACAASRYDLRADPLFTNNSLMPCMGKYDRSLIHRLKQRAAAF